MKHPLLLALAALACAPAAIQPPLSHPSPSVAGADTVDVRRVQRSARGAQQRFERTRWSTLDLVWARGGYDCHEVIGRFCLWYSEGDSSWEPPEEPARLAAERDALLAELRRAAQLTPGDDWVHGQLVRYLIEGDRTVEALDAARACGGERWWCAALTGYALHASGRFVAAETEFDRALALMPARQRRQWTDLSPLLSPSDLRAYRRLSDARRDSVERRFWWLGNPMYSVPGNERRSEHFSRHVLERIFSESRRQEQVSWAADTREILIRFGAPRGWERIRQPLHASAGSRPVVTHFEARAREFLPSFGIMADPAGVEPNAWPVRVSRPRTEYRPAYAEVFADLESQVGVFRRGDGALVIAAWELPDDTVGVGEPVRAALVQTEHERAAPRIVGSAHVGRRGVISAEVPARNAVVSVEVIATDSRRAARARHGLRAAKVAGSGFALSDVLLLDATGGAPPPDSLDDALGRLRGALRARRDESLALFFEVYGLSAQGEDVDVEISLREERRRGGLARALGIGRAPASVEMRWREHARGPLWPRGIELRLGELPAGTYLLDVVVSRRGEGRATTNRRVEIR